MLRSLIGLFFVLLAGCCLFISAASASWAYMFVVYDGNTYVISETQVDPKQIGSKIGKVTKHSGQEGTYSGNFSNSYPRGTTYYEIMGVDIKDAIAVKESEGLFIKAIYKGEYAGNKYSWQDFVPYIVAVLLLLVTVYFIKKRSNR